MRLELVFVKITDPMGWLARGRGCIHEYIHIPVIHKQFAHVDCSFHDGPGDRLFIFMTETKRTSPEPTDGTSSMLLPCAAAGERDSAADG